jgi:hypothetical protein
MLPGVEQLSTREREIIRLAADAFFPSDGPLPISGSEAGAVDYFEEHYRRSDERKRSLLRSMLWFVEWSPIMFGPRRRRFSRQSPDDRGRTLEIACQSDIYLRRMAYLSLRVVLTLAYFVDPRVVMRVGALPSTDPFGLDAQPPLAAASGTRLTDGGAPPAADEQAG